MGNQLRPSLRGLRPRDEVVPKNILRRFSESKCFVVRFDFSRGGGFVKIE